MNDDLDNTRRNDEEQNISIRCDDVDNSNLTNLDHTNNWVSWADEEFDGAENFNTSVNDDQLKITNKDAVLIMREMKLAVMQHYLNMVDTHCPGAMFPCAFKVPNNDECIPKPPPSGVIEVSGTGNLRAPKICVCKRLNEHVVWMRSKMCGQTSKICVHTVCLVKLEMSHRTCSLM